jgi:hypothetical protein
MTDNIIFRFGRAMRLVDVTPELAGEWLATLPGGRRADPGKVRRYVALMRAGSWALMEMPVVIRYGVLRSSWNRLSAVIEADMTIPMYVSDDQCPR